MFTDSLSLRLPKTLAMEEKRRYVRQVVAYANYFKDFKKTLSRQVLSKIYQVFIYIMTFEDVPEKFLKSIVNVKGLYEIRVEESGNIYRIFCCMDEGNLVILFNGFQKKTQKTPSNEIKRAKRIMDEYFQQKQDERRI
jgi:phage-related protein